MRSRRRLLPAASVLIFSALISATAAAQTPRPAGSAEPRNTAAQAAPIPTPANNATGNAAAQAPIPIPPPPSVDDPMLAPLPPPARVIASWAQALQLIRANSTDLRTAYDEVSRAEAQYRTALAGTLPSLTGNVAYTHQLLVATGFNPLTGTQTTTPTENTMTGNLSFSQPLFVPRVWHSLGTARRQEDAAELSLEDEKRTIALGVANAVIAVVTAERIAELNRSGFRAALERLDLTRRKQALGAATGLDVVRAQQDVESARATLVTGDESLRQSREALGLALGIPDGIGVDPQVNLDSLVENAMSTCKQTTNIEQRADIAASRVRADIASREVGDVDWQFSPTASLGSGFGGAFINPGTPNPTWNIQAVLSWNIWDGGARYGALRNARVDEDEAALNLTALRRNASIQLVQAQRGVTVAEASRKVASDARQLAAENDRLTQIGYTSGSLTSLDLVTAAQALRAAEIQLALEDFNLVKARVLALLQLANCPW